MPQQAGIVHEFDRRRVLCLDRAGDVLRFELVPTVGGTELVFTHRVAGGPAWGGGIFAAQHAAGWDVCLAIMGNRLAGRDPARDDEMARWFDRNLEYVDDFGLAEGMVLGVGVGSQIAFVRALVQPAAAVWEFVTEGNAPALGGDAPPRLTNPHVPVGPVTEVEPRVRVAYAAEPGTVRLYLEPRDFGCVLRLTHSVPGGTAPEMIAALLAVWQTHLEVLVSTVHGRVCPWPSTRAKELERRYRSRLLGE